MCHERRHPPQRRLFLREPFRLHSIRSAGPRRADLPIASTYPIITGVPTNGTRAVLRTTTFFREGLAGLLEARPRGRGPVRNALELIGSFAGSAPTSRSPTSGCLPRTRPKVSMPRVIREELPQIAILILSAHVQVEQATDLLAAAEQRLSAQLRTTPRSLSRWSSGSSEGDRCRFRVCSGLAAARRVNDLSPSCRRANAALSLMARPLERRHRATTLITEGTVEKHVPASS